MHTCALARTKTQAFAGVQAITLAISGPEGGRADDQPSGSCQVVQEL